MLRAQGWPKSRFCAFATARMQNLAGDGAGVRCKLYREASFYICLGVFAYITGTGSWKPIGSATRPVSIVTTSLASLRQTSHVGLAQLIVGSSSPWWKTMRR